MRREGKEQLGQARRSTCTCKRVIHRVLVSNKWTSESHVQTASPDSRPVCNWTWTTRDNSRYSRSRLRWAFSSYTRGRRRGEGWAVGDGLEGYLHLSPPRKVVSFSTFFFIFLFSILFFLVILPFSRLRSPRPSAALSFWKFESGSHHSWGRRR